MWAIVEKLGLIKECKINEVKLLRFLKAVEDGYRNNPYHCRVHAADVVHGVYWFCQTAKLGAMCGINAHEMYCLLLAAAIHDYEHPGVNNVYLAYIEHGLALRYNNASILESHSCTVRVFANFYPQGNRSFPRLLA
jgi:hypothetical protein